MPSFIKNLTFDCEDALRALTGMGEEVERLIALGATVVERYDDITVMQDPEGNEFCVEPGPNDPHQASDR